MNKRSKPGGGDFVEFISYSQNFEDLMLHRALGHINDGVYVDVGANDPTEDSVTKAFYDRGWSGINIEPLERVHSKLSKERTRDTNLNILVGKAESEVDFYDVDGGGLSTTKAEIAKMHEDREGYPVEKRSIKMLTLAQVHKMHPRPEIHFLKIDVEGAERDVLEGADLTKVRPWFIVVEATKPCSQETTFHEWESLILQHDYQRVYFDGLNCFYLANEHRDLARAFVLPPNIFDNFVLYRQMKKHEKELDARAARIQELLNSTSFRITAPLRKLRELF